jgi:hypothetical protein
MRRLAPLLLATALLVACKSDAEKLVDLRTELRTELDALYGAYGGGATAGQLKAEAEKAERPDEGAGVAARLVGELDRSYFDGTCLARGRGERPFSFSARLDAFLKEPGNEARCRDAARLAARIADLEAKTPR